MRGKETADIDVLFTPGNGDRKTMQPIGITSGSPSRKGSGTSSTSPDEHIPKNTYRKEFGCLHVTNKPRDQEKQQM